MTCDVGTAAEGLENELWRRWSDVRVGEWGGTSFANPYTASPTSQFILQPFHRFTHVIAHSTALLLLHLRHSSFSNPSAALPTSQLILQPFRCFTYVIGTSPMSQRILQHFRRFIYATAHSPTLPPLHLHHKSFYNPSVVSPTSQALHVLHLASHPCIGGWKNSLWWTSLLQQVTKFRSSYSFG